MIDLIQMLDAASELRSIKRRAAEIIAANGNSVSFWAMVDVRGRDECWVWTGAKTPLGYGHLTAGYTGQTKAHRVAFEFGHGIPPAGKVVCHRCDEPACCNPNHLWLGSQKDNVRDAIAKGRMKIPRNVPPPPPPRGEAHFRAKLSEKMVREIMISADDAPTLAKRFGVTKASILDVRSGKAWRHITGGPCQPYPRSRPVIADGNRYPSVRAARIALGIGKTAFHRRLHTQGSGIRYEDAR